MIEAVSKFLFTEPKEKQDFFSGEVLGTSDFSFSFKRKVFTRMLERFRLIADDSIKQSKSNLNKMMLWRNAFAHGQVLHDHHGGYVLQCYSGGHKELVLDDVFWSKPKKLLGTLCIFATESSSHESPKRSKVL